MEAVHDIVREYKSYNCAGVPMHTIDPDLMEDDTYTCIMLYEDSLWTRDALRGFPATADALSATFGRGLRRAFIAIMRGPKFLAPHRNEDAGCDTLRCHIGIDVHKGCDGALCVNGVEHRWEQGEGFVFDTRDVHSVRKSSDYTRAVLVADFLAATAPQVGFRRLHGSEL